MGICIIQIQLFFKYLGMEIENIQTFLPNKRLYSRIPLKKKIALIKLVFRKAKTIDQAIIELQLKKTTAVNIINKYKETGSYPMRKYKKERSCLRKKIDFRKLEAQCAQRDQSQDNGSISKSEIVTEKNLQNEEVYVLKEEPDDPAAFYRFY